MTATGETTEAPPSSAAAVLKAAMMAPPLAKEGLSRRVEHVRGQRSGPRSDDTIMWSALVVLEHKLSVFLAPYCKPYRPVHNVLFALMPLECSKTQSHYLLKHNLVEVCGGAGQR